MTAAHTAPGVQPEAIPAELRALSQWVAWRYETRGDKRTKAPINAKSNGRLVYAKSNDPETWASLADALEACGRHADLDGIGFCFAPDDGLTGIDLDHVIDPDTGELEPEAAEILERFKDTYIEVSPSGTGLRLFCYGRPGRSGKNVGRVKWCEVYSHPSSRYLTVTGNHWSGSATAVTEQQAALDWLHARFMASTGQEPVASKPGPSVALTLDDAALLPGAGARPGINAQSRLSRPPGRAAVPPLPSPLSVATGSPSACWRLSCARNPAGTKKPRSQRGLITGVEAPKEHQIV